MQLLVNCTYNLCLSVQCFRFQLTDIISIHSDHDYVQTEWAPHGTRTYITSRLVMSKSFKRRLRENWTGAAKRSTVELDEVLLAGTSLAAAYNPFTEKAPPIGHYMQDNKSIL